MIEFKEVTKLYGSTIAIDRISLKLPETGIYCLLGRNGAGKTTFMKLLAGYIAATEGEVTVDGKAVSTGRMPENVNFITSGGDLFNIKVSSLINMAAALQDDFDRVFALKMMARFELAPNKKYRSLSFGMKTMLTTIITLANTTGAVLLDEPTLGFDPIMRDQFNTLLMESFSLHPRLIIVSTHLIDEIAKVSERLIIIDHGRILLQSGINDMNGAAADNFSLQDFFVNLVGGKNNE
jgi:ABC-2 type transport system ATP-binding protein